MKKLLVLTGILILFDLAGIAKSNYQKNYHVIYKVKKDKENYIINYTFMDHVGNLIQLNYKFDIKQTDKDIDRFGVPRSLLKPYQKTPDIEAQRKKTIKNGLFKLKDNTIMIDYSAAVNYYAPRYCQSIANALIDNLRKKGLDTRHHRIEMAMKFVQDIPYAIPDDYEGKNFTGGALCPPEVLIEGYGDCDSKTMLFVGIISYMISSGDIIFVGVKNHMLAAIKNEPVPGGVFFKYKGNKYYLAETAGPGRQAFGEQGKDYKKNARIEPFKFAYSVQIPPTTDKETFVAKDNKYYYIKIENLCNSDATYLIRYKDIKGNWVFSGWKTLKKKKISEVYTTQEPSFYIYAYSGNIMWKGKKKFSFEGKSYEFNKVDIESGQSSDYTMRLRCK